MDPETDLKVSPNPSVCLTTHRRPSGFLGGRSAKPAYLSRLLLMVGDVQSNLGQSNGRAELATRQSKDCYKAEQGLGHYLCGLSSLASQKMSGDVSRGY